MYFRSHSFPRGAAEGQAPSWFHPTVNPWPLDFKTLLQGSNWRLGIEPSRSLGVSNSSGAMVFIKRGVREREM